jgi:hypothetical protein
VPNKVRRTKSILSRPSRALRPTLRGLTTGSLRVTHCDDRTDVVLWGDDFCSWLGVLTELKLRPIAVLLSSLESVELVKACVEADCYVGSVQDMTGPLLDSLAGTACLGLVDGRVTTQICALATTLGLKGVLGTSSMRRKIDDWSHDTWSTTHCEVGGVTTRRTHGCYLVPGSKAPAAFDSPPCVGRDASTVLSPMTTAFKFRPLPEERVLFPLRCENLGSAHQPVYHGGGLLPGSLDTHTAVLTPGVFVPKHNWALRPLTLEEVLVAKDFGAILPKLMRAGHLSRAFLQKLCPGKLLVAIAGHWGCNGGG